MTITHNPAPPRGPFPLGAISVEDWVRSPNGAGWYRHFTMRSFEVAYFASLRCWGLEYVEDGIRHIAREVRLDPAGYTHGLLNMNIAQATALAEALDEVAAYVARLDAADAAEDRAL